jgi:hypothetical protein
VAYRKATGRASLPISVNADVLDDLRIYCASLTSVFGSFVSMRSVVDIALKEYMKQHPVPRPRSEMLVP